MQLRPRAIQRLLLHRDGEFRHAMRWYTRIGRRVWLHEVGEFLFSRLLKNGPRLRDFLGASLQDREYVQTRKRSIRSVSSANPHQYTFTTHSPILPSHEAGKLQSPQYAQGD